MTLKLWNVEDVQRHLQAVRVSMRAGPPPTNEAEKKALVIYQSGSQATLAYLLERFGLTDASPEPPHLPRQTSTLRLKTWTRQDIKEILEETQQIMHQTPFINLNGNLPAYHQGINKTLQAIAWSFGIQDLVLEA